jgi:bifunctional DNA-binding transcriptional regulator/antitoxin component of YhaV-PrlF toxin-antitoxin module
VNVDTDGDLLELVGNDTINGSTLAQIKKVDEQGRISLPAGWRATNLRGSNEVVVVERGGLLVVKPKGKPDLTRHFDAVEVDLDPKNLTDYSTLKKTILGRRRH